MTFRSGRIALAVAVGWALTAPSTASALVIDSFDDDFAVEIGLGGLPNPTEATGGSLASGGPNGARAVVLTRTAGGGSASVDTNLSEANALSVSTGAGVAATALVIWDGDDDVTLNPNGLGGFDIAPGGEQFISVSVLADQSGIGLRLTLYENGGGSATIDWVTAGGNTFDGGTAETFSESLASLGIDPSNIGAITLEVFGPTSFDVQITSFQTVIPEPGALALVGLGLAGLAIQGRRRAH